MSPAIIRGGEVHYPSARYFAVSSLGRVFLSDSPSTIRVRLPRIESQYIAGNIQRLNGDIFGFAYPEAVAETPFEREGGVSFIINAQQAFLRNAGSTSHPEPLLYLGPLAEKLVLDAGPDSYEGKLRYAKQLFDEWSSQASNQYKRSNRGSRELEGVSSRAQRLDRLIADMSRDSAKE